jgi:hypothetical protein
MSNGRVTPKRHDSHKKVSGKTGAVQSVPIRPERRGQLQIGSVLTGLYA